MGNVSMDASQINYRGGETKMSVEQALKGTSGEAAAIAQLQTDVGNLQTTKANQITIAPFFSAETAYDPGALVYYNGLTYRCTNAHEGEWDADDFAATTIANELSSLESGLTSVENKAMNPKSTAALATILVAENTKSVTATVNGFVSVKTNNVGAAAATVSCMARNVTQDIGAAATYAVAAFTGAHLVCVPVNAGDNVIVDISGHTVDATINQTGTTPS